MPANTVPVYTKTPSITFAGTITTANTAKDGTGTVLIPCTAGANGALMRSISFRALGTNVATVARIFANNGSTNTTAANNALIREVTLAATTLSETSALQHYEVPIGIAMPAGYRLLVTIGTTVAAGYSVVGYCSDF